MEHTASVLRRCLLLLTVTGCGTSNAFLPATAGGGQAGAPATAMITSSTIGAGNTLPPVQPTAPAPPLGMAGAAGGNVVTSPVMPASAGAPATQPMPMLMPNAMAGMLAVPPTAAGAVSVAPSSRGCKQTKYSLAIRLTTDMSWQESIALMAGTGKFYAWSKLTIDPGASTVSELRSCGSLTPVFHGTAVAGGFSAFQRVPVAAYDAPSMPVVAGGSAMRSDSALTLMPNPLLVGLSLPDPAGPWPASSRDTSLMPIDADGDGKRGITSRVRNDPPFTGSPTSILQTDQVDAVYVGNRLAFRATLNDPACADALEGTAELLAMDQLTLGCHVKDRDDCRSDELAFLEDNRPQVKIGTAAVVHAVVIPLDASCAQVVKLLEVPGP